MSDYILDAFVAPIAHLRHPNPVEPPVSIEDRITELLEHHKKGGSIVTIIIDDAQKLMKDEYCLGLLLEYMLEGRLRLIFVSGNDDPYPDFTKSSGYRTRTRSLRFEPPVAQIDEVLKQSQLTLHQRDMVTQAVGYSMGDIQSVFVNLPSPSTPASAEKPGPSPASYTDEQVSEAIQAMLDDLKTRIIQSVSSVPIDMASKGEVYDFLDLVTCDATTTLDPDHHFSSDPDKRNRMVAVGNFLEKGNLLSKVYTRNPVFIWRTHSYFTAHRRTKA
jgi:hypothetical protein